MTPLLQTAGWTLIHFVWQGTAIAGATSALLRLTRRRYMNAAKRDPPVYEAARLPRMAVMQRLQQPPHDVDGQMRRKGALFAAKMFAQLHQAHPG